MRTGLGVAWGAVALALVEASMAGAQSSVGAHPGAQVLLSSEGLVSVSASVGSLARGEIVREIDDPHTGERWLLLRNDQVPGGPGRLVLVHRNEPGGAVRQAVGRVAAEAGATPVPPVIRSGDRLIVEEHTAVVDAVLEARALAPAAAGSALAVRLTIGGRVVRAVALGPGRAALQPESGVWP